MIWLLALTILLAAAVVHYKDQAAHEEREFLIQQAERERNQLMNRLMARDIGEYRAQVITEAQVKAEPAPPDSLDEQMTAMYGDTWREMM